MSVAWDRLLRMMRYDRYLPMKCFATTKSWISYCDCLIVCKYRESRLSRDYSNSQSVKAPQSQGHKDVPP